MADFGFVGPSYEAPSIYQDAQECINFYGEIDPYKQQGGRGYVALYPTPGLTKILQLDEAEVRGMRALSGGQWLVVVVGNKVYSVTQGYVATHVGTLTTSTGYVSITDNITSANGLTAYIVDGVNRYAWIAGSESTITLNYEISSNLMYIPSIPCGTIYVGQVIEGYSAITSFGTGTGGIGTYNLSGTITNGTVTALTITNPGSGFVGLPIITLEPPEATYGTIATATVNSIKCVSASVDAGGSGYTAGDVLTAVGGAFSTAATFTVGSVSGGVIQTISITNAGVYTSAVISPVTVTGGTGSNATLNLSFGLNNDITITNNGSFYSAVPAVTIEGGSGAAITATSIPYVVGSQEADVFTKLPVTDGPWTGASVCDVIDNYIIYNQVGTQNWAATDLGSVVSANAYYGTKDGEPDPIVSIIADHRQVYLLGTQTTEVWVDVGSQIPGFVSFPFQRVAGTMMQHGCAAAFSIAQFEEQLMFVAQDARGQGVIGAVQGYSFVRLSNHAVEQTLMNVPLSDATAYTYRLEGHEFYVVTFPSIDLTWVYDLTTKSWHKWLSYNEETGYHRHRSNCGAFFNNQYIVGDYENGKIYQLDNENYTEDGELIRRLRRAPHIVTDLQRQYFAEMQIQFQPGVGLQNGQGKDPQAMLRWSNDGGSTWSNEHWTSIGKVGRYQNRAIWRRLGWSRDRIYEVAISDPVKTVIVSANLKAEQGDN